MPLPVAIPIHTPGCCHRCDQPLVYATQEDHDTFHDTAELLLSIAGEAPDGAWVVGELNPPPNESPLRLKRGFLPAKGFRRMAPEVGCGSQLAYAIGHFWPMTDRVSVLSAQDALQSGLVPWEDFFRYLEDECVVQSLRHDMVDAIVALPDEQKRALLLGMPIPDKWAGVGDDDGIGTISREEIQFWRRFGDTPIKSWSSATGGGLHLTVPLVLERLYKAGELQGALPAQEDVFRAFDLISPEAVKVVILGQDPYPDPEHAMGVAFSTRSAKLPASLRNIFKELASDLQVPMPISGNLEPWVQQGVLLANTALTLGKDGASHHEAWSLFTRCWIKTLAERQSIVWVLWGKHAQQWRPYIEERARKPQVIIESVHPSPLSAHRGFFGSRPFSKVNEALATLGHPPIRWVV